MGFDYNQLQPDPNSHELMRNRLNFLIIDCKKMQKLSLILMEKRRVRHKELLGCHGFYTKLMTFSCSF